MDPQLIEYIPKSDARALRRKGRLERKQKRLRDLLLLLRRRRQNMKRKSWLRHAPTRATTIQQQQQNVDEFDGVTELQKEIIQEQLQLHNHQHQEQQIRDACVASSQQLQASYGGEEQMVYQQEDAYFERQRFQNRPKLAVIIADDNEINLKILTRLFSKVFFREVKVIACKDGFEAIEAYKSLNKYRDNSINTHESRAEQVRLAMIVTDFQMPNCDGLSACKYIRAMEKFAQEEEYNAMMTMNTRDDDKNNNNNNNNNNKPPFDQKFFEKVPILMFTTEFHTVLPALIEGIVDDRLAKPCSCKDFIFTVHKHMPNFILEEYADLLVPLRENTLFKRKFSSEVCLSRMLMEASSNLDGGVSEKSTNDSDLEQTRPKLNDNSNKNNDKNNINGIGKVEPCFYDVAEGDISAEDDDDDDDDDDDINKQNMKEAKENAHWNLVTFSPKRVRKGQTNEKTNDVKFEGNKATNITMKQWRGNEINTFIPSSGVTNGKKRLSLDSYVRSCRTIWMQTKSRLTGISHRINVNNIKEKQTRASVVVRNKASPPELRTYEETNRDNLQYYQLPHRNGVYDTM